MRTQQQCPIRRRSGCGAQHPAAPDAAGALAADAAKHGQLWQLHMLTVRPWVKLQASVVSVEGRKRSTRSSDRCVLCLA